MQIEISQLVLEYAVIIKEKSNLSDDISGRIKLTLVAPNKQGFDITAVINAPFPRSAPIWDILVGCPSEYWSNNLLTATVMLCQQKIRELYKERYELEDDSMFLVEPAGIRCNSTGIHGGI